jgi:hypothetical protein
MKKKLVLSVIVGMISACAMSQNVDNPGGNSALAVELGASVNYYYGQPSRNFDKFENDRVNWQLNGMLGITLARDRQQRRTMIAAFGAFGFNNDVTLTNVLADQKYSTTASGQSSGNNFYQLEGGLIIADVIRISTGAGQQNFTSQNLVSSNGVLLNATSLKYNSTTVGFQFNLGPVVWTINCNFNYGQDYNKTIINPNTGLMLKW